MKQLTLNKTWTECLRMWRWIAAEKKKDNTDNVRTLKKAWLKEHGFGYMCADCFFCAYDIIRKGWELCEHCPGKLVDEQFDCRHLSYNHNTSPIAFYKKLLELNRKRKNAKKKTR